MRPGLNPAFDAVVAKGMAKSPGERFATAGELARAAAAAVHAAPRPVAAPHTRQFTAERPPAYVPHPAVAAQAPVARSRFGRTQKLLLAGTVATLGLAAGLAAAIVFTGGSTGSQPQSPLAAAPSSTTETSTSTPTTTARLSGVSNVDAKGFVGQAARCDSGTVVSAIRTASSLAVICQESPGSFYYHGERLRDGANVRIDTAVPTGAGYDAVNPADGARYQVRPDGLTIISNGHVDSAESALEYGSAN